MSLFFVEYYGRCLSYDDHTEKYVRFSLKQRTPKGFIRVVSSERMIIGIKTGDTMKNVGYPSLASRRPFIKRIHPRQ